MDRGGHGPAAAAVVNGPGRQGSLIHREDDDIAAPSTSPQELRERANRLVQEARKEDPERPLNAAEVRVVGRVGVNADTAPGWCRQADIDTPIRKLPG